MGTMLDYIAWRGDLSFRDDAFNEVDNLILSELAYTKMEEIVDGPESGRTVTLPEICAACERLGRSAEGNANDPYPLLRAAAAAPRFASIRAGAYVNIIDEERDIQFSAVSFHLEDGTLYVAFRGTDNTIIGWREDFTISYLKETPGQYEAVRYLERAAAGAEGPLLVGGHSKGGNLAVYAAAFCNAQTRARIVTVYSNDGPGFNHDVVEKETYREILPRVSLFIPEASIIGILLFNKEEKTVVRSNAAGARQHDPYTWEVLGKRFVTVESQTTTSLFLDETLDRWVEGLDRDQISALVSVIFDSMEATGAQTLTELRRKRWHSYRRILQSLQKTDPAVQKTVMEMAKKLIASGRDVLREDTQSTLQEWLSGLGAAVTDRGDRERKE